MASHPIPLPDALKSNLQVTLVAIIKTALLWQCVQLVLSPASDCFKVTEGKTEREKERERCYEARRNGGIVGARRSKNVKEDNVK